MKVLPITIGEGLMHWDEAFINVWRDTRSWFKDQRFDRHWFKAQPPLAQFGLLMLIALYGSLVIYQWMPKNVALNSVNAAAASLEVPYPDLVPAPLGAARYDSNAEQFQWRAERIIDTRTFWIMREGDAIAGAERITGDEYQRYLTAAAQMYKVNKFDVEAIHFLESFGKQDAQSPTGPKGPGQFTVRTGAGIGPVKDGKCLVRLQGVPCGQTLPKKLPPIAEDNRSSVELSVYATAKLLASEQDFFGDRDFAIMAYHSSRGDVRMWIKKYLDPQPTDLGGKTDLQKYHLNYAQLYFGSTPYKNPGTYAMYRDIMAEDWGANYPWKVRCAQKLLQLYRTVKPAFMQLAKQNKYKGKRATYRMWTFYSDNDKALVSVEDLKAKIKSGELVTVPQNPERFGFKLRLEGKGMIAELDKPNQQNYIASKQETVGALVWIGQELKKLRCSLSANSFLLDVTSISRTVEYQNKLTKKNSTATTQLSFHVLGLAFDITKNGLSADQDRDLRFILDELDSTGMISWVPENAAYHVVVAPDDTARQFFTRIYNDNKEIQASSPLVVTDQWF